MLICFFSLDALSEIQGELSKMDYFCYGESRLIEKATELTGLLETTSSVNPPRPDNLTLYGNFALREIVFTAIGKKLKISHRS